MCILHDRCWPCKPEIMQPMQVSIRLSYARPCNFVSSLKSTQRLARYCSRECQKSAWKAGHKTSCGRVVGADEPSSVALSKWIDEWKGALMSWSCWALDLTNNPRDRLSTHMSVQLLNFRIFDLISNPRCSFFIRVEPRPNPPRRTQSHRASMAL